MENRVQNFELVAIHERKSKFERLLYKFKGVLNITQQKQKISTSSPHYKLKVVKAPLDENKGPFKPLKPRRSSYLRERWPDRVKLDDEDDSTFSMERVEKLLKSIEEKVDYEDDMPSPNMINPYVEDYKRCILCQYNVTLDYKNARLLSQFVSPYTGRIYGRKVTGLCIPMQKHLSNIIKQSRFFGFMPYTYKKSDYLEDPKLFDPFKIN